MSNYDPLDLPGQARDKAKADARQKLERDVESADLKWLMDSKRGRRIVFGLLDRACLNKSSFSTNAMSMAFVEGRRLEGLRVMSMINALCPELYPVMLKESSNDNRNTDDDRSHHAN